MTRRRTVRCALAASALVLSSSVPPPRNAARGESVDLALVLAVDASGSVDQVRFELQKQGYVAAFRHPRVMAGDPVRADAVDRRHHDAVDRAGAAGDRGAVDQDL